MDPKLEGDKQVKLEGILIGLEFAHKELLQLLPLLTSSPIGRAGSSDTSPAPSFRKRTTMI